MHIGAQRRWQMAPDRDNRVPFILAQIVFGEVGACDLDRDPAFGGKFREFG